MITCFNPPSIIGPGLNNAATFSVLGVEFFNVHWYATYGVQIDNTTSLSQYCTVGSDTTATSDVIEGVNTFCFTTPGKDCPTCDVVTFTEGSPAWEVGFFSIS